MNKRLAVLIVLALVLCACTTEKIYLLESAGKPPVIEKETTVKFGKKRNVAKTAAGETEKHQESFTGTPEMIKAMMKYKNAEDEETVVVVKPRAAAPAATATSSGTDFFDIGGTERQRRLRGPEDFFQTRIGPDGVQYEHFSSKRRGRR